MRTRGPRSGATRHASATVGASAAPSPPHNPGGRRVRAPTSGKVRTHRKEDGSTPPRTSPRKGRAPQRPAKARSQQAARTGCCPAKSRGGGRSVPPLALLPARPRRPHPWGGGRRGRVRRPQQARAGVRALAAPCSTQSFCCGGRSQKGRNKAGQDITAQLWAGQTRRRGRRRARRRGSCSCCTHTARAPGGPGPRARGTGLAQGVQAGGRPAVVHGGKRGASPAGPARAPPTPQRRQCAGLRPRPATPKDLRYPDQRRPAFRAVVQQAGWASSGTQASGCALSTAAAGAPPSRPGASTRPCTSPV